MNNHRTIRREQLSWLNRLTIFFQRRDTHHRICRLCHKPIKRGEHWHQVQVGWFAPVYTVEHKDCKNPLKDVSHQIVKRLEPELPFNEFADPFFAHEGNIYRNYDDLTQEKLDDH